MGFLKAFKSFIKRLNDSRKQRIPVHIWFIAYFVGLRKELSRTQWLKGKRFGYLVVKVFVVIILLAGSLFLVNYGIVNLFGEIGIL